VGVWWSVKKSPNIGLCPGFEEGGNFKGTKGPKAPMGKGGKILGYWGGALAHRTMGRKMNMEKNWTKRSARKTKNRGITIKFEKNKRKGLA